MTDAPETTPAAATATETTTTEVTETLGDNGQKALAEERRLRKEAEKRAKQNETDLQKLRDANMNEVDRALQAAKAEGLTEGLRSAGTRLVGAEVRAAAAGRNVNTDALIEALDATKFLDAEGEPDIDAIKAWVDLVAPVGDEDTTEIGDGFRMPDLGQGTRTPAQLAPHSSDSLEADLKRMLGVR